MAASRAGDIVRGMIEARFHWLIALSLAASCQPSASPTPPKGETATTPEEAKAGQDIVSTHLALDLSSTTGRATLEILPAKGTLSVWAAVSGLEVTAVTLNDEAVDPTIEGGVLRLPVSDDEMATVVVDYHFPERSPAAFDGWMPALGVTFIWPYSCANLFPCDPALRDGVVFSMEVSGVEEGLTAIFPPSTWSDAPAYQPAVSVGAYEELAVGTTSAGTQIVAWYLPDSDGKSDAEAGTEHLTAVVDYYEQVYGPYLFGPRMGTVEVDWGADSWGGMEHHPYFHVGKFDFPDEEAQAHEAAHAWYGDGVRLACWEDFVLSEGTTTYIAARAMEQVGGPDFWSYYVDDFLIPICRGQDTNTIVLPETCNEIDFLNDDLWSLATYMKGACFYEEVADAVGPELLDGVIGQFYAEHGGQAARMRDMIDAIEAAVDPSQVESVEAAATDWLLSYECPTDYATRCRSHQ